MATDSGIDSAAPAICPVCGGADRRAIALGYWECASVVVRTGWASVPDELGPRGPNGEPMAVRPVQTSHSEVCAHRYQSGAPSGTPVCDDGIFAIALCQDCSRPVCGDCGVAQGQARLCRADVARRAKEAQREAEARQQAMDAAHTADLRARIAAGELPTDEELARSRSQLAALDSKLGFAPPPAASVASAFKGLLVSVALWFFAAGGAVAAFGASGDMTRVIPIYVVTGAVLLAGWGAWLGAGVRARRAWDRRAALSGRVSALRHCGRTGCGVCGGPQP